MKAPFVLGLTGSIGMGKSTTATMFQEEGVPVWDADAVVDKLYGPGGKAVGPLRDLNSAVVVGGAVDRNRLKNWIRQDPTALARIEAVVHPLVADDRAIFIAEATADIVLLDVPLLFEGEIDKAVDAVVVVTAPGDVQRSRVLARPGMTEAQFETLLARQMPDAEKRARADYIIETLNMDDARKDVREILARVRGRRDARDRT
ncbi:MAG: dephospho-CoA kinase [Pseudomonadota bacterium]